MSLRSNLIQKKEAITKKWLQDTLDTYHPDTASFLKNKKDRFANPVGHALKEGTQVIVEALLKGGQRDVIVKQLDEIIKIRAIQECAPSQAVSFLPLLKKAVRSETKGFDHHETFAQELIALEDEVDVICLLAFDAYAKQREKIFDLRVKEVKRNISVFAERSGKCPSSLEKLSEGCK